MYIKQHIIIQNFVVNILNKKIDVDFLACKYAAVSPSLLSVEAGVLD